MQNVELIYRKKTLQDLENTVYLNAVEKQIRADKLHIGPTTSVKDDNLFTLLAVILFKDEKYKYKIQFEAAIMSLILPLENNEKKKVKLMRLELALNKFRYSEHGNLDTLKYISFLYKINFLVYTEKNEKLQILWKNFRYQTKPFQVFDGNKSKSMADYKTAPLSSNDLTIKLYKRF